MIAALAIKVPGLTVRNLSWTIEREGQTSLKKTRATSEISEPQEPSGSGDDDRGSADELYTYERPTRIPARKRTKIYPVFSASRSATIKKDLFSTFIYAPLSKDEFRIVCVAPGKEHDRVVYWLAITPISQPLSYEALTYLWSNIGL